MQAIHREMRAALDNLVTMARRAAPAPDPLLVAALQVHLSRSQQQRVRVVVAGEMARGKTTLVNRLLGVAALPTGTGSVKHPVCVRHGDVWRALDGEQRTLHTGLPMAWGRELRTVEGPADLLTTMDIIDLPGLNDHDAGFESEVVAEIVLADVALICLSANQLLSETERAVIEKRVLPVATGRLALVVNRTEGVDSPDDDAELKRRAKRFIDRTAASGKAIDLFFLPPHGDGLSAGEPIVSYVRSTARALDQLRTSRWARRTLALLSAFEPWAADPGVPETTLKKDEESAIQARDLSSMLDREFLLAKREAESLVSEGMAHQRGNLPDLLAEWPHVDEKEITATLIGRVQEIGINALSAARTSLESGLRNELPLGQRIAFDAAPVPQDPKVLGEPVESKPSGGIFVLEAIGASLLVMGASPIPMALGSMAVFIASEMRKTERERGLSLARDAVEADLSEWVQKADTAIRRHLESTLTSSKDATKSLLMSAIQSKSQSIEPTETPDVRAAFLPALQQAMRDCAVLAQSQGARE